MTDSVKDKQSDDEERRAAETRCWRDAYLRMWKAMKKRQIAHDR